MQEDQTAAAPQTVSEDTPIEAVPKSNLSQTIQFKRGAEATGFDQACEGSLETTAGFRQRLAEDPEAQFHTEAVSSEQTAHAIDAHHTGLQEAGPVASDLQLCL